MLRVIQLGHEGAATEWEYGPQSLGLQRAPPGLLFLLQTYTAVYYVLADLVMLSLYFHYKFKKRPSPRECGGLSMSGMLG